MKPHMKVIQRNGVDIFVTSSMEVKAVTRREAFNLQGEIDDYYLSYARRYSTPGRMDGGMSSYADNVSIGSFNI